MSISNTTHFVNSLMKDKYVLIMFLGLTCLSSRTVSWRYGIQEVWLCVYCLDSRCSTVAHSLSAIEDLRGNDSKRVGPDN